MRLNSKRPAYSSGGPFSCRPFAHLARGFQEAMVFPLRRNIFTWFETLSWIQTLLVSADCSMIDRCPVYGATLLFRRTLKVMEVNRRHVMFCGEGTGPLRGSGASRYVAVNLLYIGSHPAVIRGPVTG